MAEYIERARARFEFGRFFKGQEDVQHDCDSLLCTLPAADVVEVAHGRWLKQDDYSCCSCCGQAVADECCPWFKFCPNCGADMRGEENE